ncbi:MAG TPA: hypothetical protein VKJ47_12000 [Candidatus Binatia bacterium]|nr:hypothetical protein [Candidatus Binatia bacterium]
MDDLNALTALIYGRVGKLLADGTGSQLAKIQPKPGVQNLLQQLRGDTQLPQAELDVFSGLLDLHDLVSDRDLGDQLHDFFAEQVNVVKRLVEANSPAEILAISREVVTGQLQDLRDTIVPLIGRQFGIALSFVTTLRNLPTPEAKNAIQDAVLRYFFSKEGYETVDKTQIVAPVHLADLDLKQLGQAKALFSERTAERYVRDAIRLIVEAAGDVRYLGLKKRYDAMRDHMPNDEKKNKFTDWFRGFSSVAESTVTGAVEEACLGAAEFQTNPLIAASASTFAGTAARKAAQHVFLSELEALL